MLAYGYNSGSESVDSAKEKQELQLQIMPEAAKAEPHNTSPSSKIDQKGAASLREEQRSWAVSEFLHVQGAHLHRDGGLGAEHHLHAADVALRAIGHEDLVGLDDGVAIKGARNCLPQVLTARLRAVPVALYLSQMCICVLCCHHFVNEHADDVAVQALVVASRKPSRPALEPFFLSSG